MGEKNGGSTGRELDVQRRELEARNEELRAARLELQESRKLYSNLYEFAPIGYLTLDAEGRIVKANLTAAAMLGAKRERLESQYLARFVADEDADVCHLHRQRVFAGEAAQTCELQMIASDGTVIHVQLQSIPVEPDPASGKQCRTALIDISERKQTEQRLQWELSVNRALADLSGSVIASSSSVPNIAEMVLESAKSLTNSVDGFVSSIDPRTGDAVPHTLTAMMGSQCQMPGADDRITFPIGPDGRYPGLWGHALNVRQAFYTNSPGDHEGSTGLPPGHVPIESLLTVPAIARGKLLGQIAVANARGGYAERHLGAVERLAVLYALAIQRQRAEDEIGALARFPSENPNPVLRISADATILYANKAGDPLTNAWHRGTGERLDDPWKQYVLDAIGSGRSREADVQCGERTFSVTFAPVVESGHVNVYALDITDRKRAEKALRESEELHRVTLSSISDAVFITDAAGAFTYICPNVDVIFGHSREDVGAMGNIGLLLGEGVFDPGDLDVAGEIANIERAVRDKSGREHAVLVNVKRVAIKGGTTLYSCRDITDRKAAERIRRQAEEQVRKLNDELERRVVERTEQLEAVNRDLEAEIAERTQTEQSLRVSEERFHSLFDGVPVGLYRSTPGPDGRAVAVNPALVQMLRYPDPESLMAVRLADVYVHAEDRRRWQALMTREGIVRDFETQLRRCDGSVIWTINTARAVRDAAGEVTHYEGSLQDISERKQAEKKVERYQHQLRAMASELWLAEERERRRLAQDLHDGPGQSLTLAKMKLETARRSVDPGPLARDLGEIGKLLDETDRSVRSLTFQIAPPVLHDLGFVRAAEWLVEDTQRKYGIEVTIRDDGRPKRLDERTRVILFRAVREVLINVAKHARATAASVSLRRDADQIYVTVQDDGDGFDPAAGPIGESGFGLFSIREQLDRLEGRVRIESTPGQGTAVTLTVPLPPERERAAGGPQ